MKAFRRWFSRRRPTSRRMAPHRDPLALLGAPDSVAGDAADDAPPRGCAWYDSSLELRRGLQVLEGPAWLQMANA